MTHRLLIAVLTASLFLVGCQHSPMDSPDSHAPRPVVLVAGGGAMAGVDATSLFHPRPVHYATVADFSTAQLAWMLDELVIPHAPADIVMQTGAVDALLAIPAERVLRDLDGILAKLREAGCEVHLIEALPLSTDANANARFAEINRAIREWAERNNVDFTPALSSPSATAATTPREQMSLHILAAHNPMANPGPTLATERIERILGVGPDEPDIVFLGDSITEMGYNWNARLGRNDIRNSGQGGYTTAQLLWFIPETVRPTRPRRCFVMAGTNDYSLGVPLEQMKANFGEIVSTLQEADIEPVLQSTLLSTDATRNATLTELNNWLQDLGREHGIAFIDLNAVLAPNGLLRPEYNTDGLHLNEQGYDAWSTILREWLEANP